MAPARVVLRGGNVVTGETVTRADLSARAGRIEAVGEIAPEPGDDVVDCSGRYLLPGFVDAHAHVESTDSAEIVIDNDHWTWPEAAGRLSENPARRVVAPNVADRATYEQPERLAGGVDDVFVAGVAVLRAGEPAGGTPGAGLRRSGGGNR